MESGRPVVVAGTAVTVGHSSLLLLLLELLERVESGGREGEAIGEATAGHLAQGHAVWGNESHQHRDDHTRAHGCGSSVML